MNEFSIYLEFHRGLSMNEFSIYFDLGDSYESDITDWIYTALSKKSSKVCVEHTFRSFLAIHCSTRVL